MKSKLVDNVIFFTEVRSQIGGTIDFENWGKVSKFLLKFYFRLKNIFGIFNKYW